MDPRLATYMRTCSVPGNEQGLRELLIEDLEPYGRVHRTRWTGFYVAHQGNKGRRRRIVVTAHLDSPGFSVRGVLPDGTLDLIALGGIDPSLMGARVIRLFCGGRSFVGVLSIDGEPSGRTTSYLGFFGFDSDIDARKRGVMKGDPVCFDSAVLEMEGGFFVGPHLDNRLGLYVMREVARRIPSDGLDCDLFFAATSAEEMGGRCARIIAEEVRPEVAICLDATYEEGDVKMGGGPVLTLSDAAVLMPATVRDIIGNIAKNASLPLQYEVFNVAGTDAEGFREAPGGCLTLSLLIATLNNHTPNEVAHWGDIQSMIELVLELLQKQSEIRVP